MVDGRPMKCGRGQCTERQRITTEGKCEDCLPTEELIDEYTCGSASCEENKILIEDGTCKECPPGM